MEKTCQARVHEFAGIDVSARELSVAVQGGVEAGIAVTTFSNNAAGHKALLLYLLRERRELASLGGERELQFGASPNLAGLISLTTDSWYAQQSLHATQLLSVLDREQKIERGFSAPLPERKT